MKQHRWSLLSKVSAAGRVATINERVQGKFQGADGGVNWFYGVVSNVRDNGTCDIHYDDGDDEEGVESKFIKVYVSRAEEDMANATVEEREALAAVVAAETAAAVAAAEAAEVAAVEAASRAKRGRDAPDDDQLEHDEPGQLDEPLEEVLPPIELTKKQKRELAALLGTTGPDGGTVRIGSRDSFAEEELGRRAGRACHTHSSRSLKSTKSPTRHAAANGYP